MFLYTHDLGLVRHSFCSFKSVEACFGREEACFGFDGEGGGREGGGGGGAIEMSKETFSLHQRRMRDRRWIGIKVFKSVCFGCRGRLRSGGGGGGIEGFKYTGTCFGCQGRLKWVGIWRSFKTRVFRCWRGITGMVWGLLN